MNSRSKPEMGTFQGTNPFSSGFDSQSHLKRFVMFDQSGGKGRVFFHPVLAEELFGSSQAPEYDKGFAEKKESNIKLLPYEQMVEGAFTSLQTLRASRQVDMSYVQQPKVTYLLPGALLSSQKPRVFESIAKDGTSWVVDDDKSPVQQCMASTTLVCEEKAKVSAILPSTESLWDCKQVGHLLSSSPVSDTKTSDLAAASGSMRENTEDLDALLSSDEDEDEDVRSTGHSPDESLCKGDGSIKDEDEEVEQCPNKRRKVAANYSNDVGPDNMSAGEEVNDKASVVLNCGVIRSNRRQKIKRTVKALRKMLPGGALLDAALILDETIMYVKTLRDRVNQLEATRFQSYVNP